MTHVITAERIKTPPPPPPPRPDDIIVLKVTTTQAELIYDLLNTLSITNAVDQVSAYFSEGVRDALNKVGITMNYSRWRLLKNNIVSNIQHGRDIVS